jgi:hypothetical protein
MNRVFIDFKLKRIQDLRAIHAIDEAGFTIVVTNKQRFKLAFLKEKFNLYFEVSKNSKGIKLSELLYINHEMPQTGIAGLTKTLIFPIQIVTHCKTLWKNERAHEFTFAGLITKSRNELLSNWIKSNITNEKFDLPITNSFVNKWRNKIYNFFNFDSIVTKKINNLIIWSSNKGRKFPVKAWDEDYFMLLGDSKFVLCPSGVCVWSYRFFESILCGAIPIVEYHCAAYEGFRFKYMTDDAKSFIWSKEDAEHNYNLCLERITIDPELLKAALVQFSPK